MREAMSVSLLLLLALSCGRANANADAVRARGSFHLSEGKYDLAIAAFDSAIAMRSDDADSYISRGNAYASKRDLDRAIQSYDSAIALRPNQSFAYKNRGMTYTTKGDFDRAIRDLDRAIALQPDYATAYNSRGFAYQMKGDYEHAVKDYDRSIELSPKSAATYGNRANVHFILGHFPEATHDLERSLSFYQAETKPSEFLSEPGAYGVIWLHLAKMRQGAADAEEFTANSARIDSTSWPGQIAAFYRGRLPADRLVALAGNGDTDRQPDQRCGAEFFIGQAAVAKKQTAEARQRFEATLGCSKRHVEREIADAELRRLGAGTR
ncbi:MAG: tetratricopeptide repeat protein [bacterium]